MKKVVWPLAVVVLAALSVTATAANRAPEGTGGAKAGKGVSDVYIVQLQEEPAATYAGGVAGLEATAPAKGRKLDRTNRAVERYTAYLVGRHDAVASSVRATKIYDYVYTVNGFAAELSKSQVATLKASKDVLSVERDVLGKVATDNTPSFLGLSAPGGLWSQLDNKAGENMIIGVIDTGIWPEHPSFSDQGDLAFRTGSTGKAKQVYGAPPASWHGTCQSGEQWSQDFCTNKLIGARYFLSGYGHFGVIQNDYKSARDADGHGSHTASTAGGNADVPASILGADLGKVSGMAPRARVASYKVCWNGEAGGCPNTDSVAAIDAAVADGVDVINFSISGTSTNYLDAVEVAFLRASAAGVFVAASAGNDGPGVSTVAHVSPWLMTVAASTHDRSFLGSTTLGNGAKYTGVTLTGGVPAQTTLVDSVAAGSELCEVGKLNPAVVSGKIVLCKRGVNARVEKSLAVKQAGGVGMILFNAVDPQTLNTDNHYVPSLHISNADGVAIKAYLAGAGTKTASLSGGARVKEGGNDMADFSSRGPSLGGAGDVLKPDITAPGVNVLAGNTPTAFLGAPGQLFQSIGGTSMSSPHIAGIAAALIQKLPTLSPAAIKSAIMTSARQNVDKEDGTTPADPFDFGAGHVVPNAAANPGLVYDAGFNDYRGFLRSQRLCTLCFGTSPAPVIDPSDLNLPSIAVGDLAGKQTITRTVTNVGPAGTYKVSVSAPRGIDVVVTPSSLTLATGESKSYTVSLTSNDRATYGSYAFGSLTWSDRTRSVRSPLVIRPLAISAPGQVTGTGVAGEQKWNVRFGYTGPAAYKAQGLIPATKTPGRVVDDPTNDFNTDAPNSNQGITVHTVTVPAGTAHTRISLFDSDTDGTDDLDLYVYNAAGTLVGVSGTGTSQEEVNLGSPAAGDYKVYVHGWETDGADSNYTLFTWVLGDTSAGNLTATGPTAAVVGEGGEVTAKWSGLTAATRYLGRVSYRNGSTETGATIIRIDS